MAAVMVNFLCPLDWPKGWQVAGKTLFWAISMNVFLEEINI